MHHHRWAIGGLALMMLSACLPLQRSAERGWDDNPPEAADQGPQIGWEDVSTPPTPVEDVAVQAADAGLKPRALGSSSAPIAAVPPPRKTDAAAPTPPPRARDTATDADGQIHGARAAIEDVANKPSLSAEDRALGTSIFLPLSMPVHDTPRVGSTSVLLMSGSEIIKRQVVRNKDGLWWFISYPGGIGWMQALPEQRVPPRR